MRQRFSGSFMWDVEENVGIVGIPQSGLLSGQQKNPSHDHMLHCGMLYLKKKYFRSRHHMLRIVACYIAIWTTCGPVQCWHCKTITMALAMTMALRETDITAKNFCDAESSPWADYRTTLLKPKAHREWKPLDFASDDLLGFNLIFWLVDCLIKEPATLFTPHLCNAHL